MCKYVACRKYIIPRCKNLLRTLSWCDFLWEHERQTGLVQKQNCTVLCKQERCKNSPRWQCWTAVDKAPRLSRLNTRVNPRHTILFGKSARNAHMHFQRLSDLNRGNRPYLKSANLCKIVLILFVECPFQTLHKGLIRKVFLMHLRWSYQTVYQNFEQKCHSLICNIMLIKLWEVLGQYKPRISETPFTMPWEQQ